MNKPTHKAIHIAKSHQPTLQQKIAKEYIFANTDRRTIKKYYCPIVAISNADNKCFFYFFRSIKNKVYYPIFLSKQLVYFQ